MENETGGDKHGRSLETMGQPVIYQNVPGAGSILGTSLGAKAAPDGYTNAVAATSDLARVRRRRAQRKLLGRSARPGWYGQTVLDRLRSVVSQGLRANAKRRRLLAQGVEPVGRTPRDCWALLESEMRRYAAAVLLLASSASNASSGRATALAQVAVIHREQLGARRARR